MKMLDTTPTISDFPTRSALVQVPPLVSSTKDGKPYKRPAHIQEQICWVLSLPQSQWMKEAKKLKSETIVFLIRRTHRVDDDLCGELIENLRKRIKKHAHRFCKSLDQVDREEILLGVEMKVLELLLTTEPSRRGEYLEVAFPYLIKDFTDDEREKLGNSPSGNIEDYVVADCDNEEEEEIERPIEFVPAEGAGPEEILLNLDNRKHRHRLLQKALKSVTNLRHREAFILHFGKDWPIASQKRGVDTLQRKFRKEPREIRYWLDTAMKQVRDALGLRNRTGHRSDGTLKRARLHPPSMPVPVRVVVGSTVARVAEASDRSAARTHSRAHAAGSAAS